MLRANGALAVVAALGGLAAPAAAQQDTTFQVVDRIAAVVGNHVITMSRVVEEINALRAQGYEIPNDSAGFMDYMREVTGQLVDQELLVQAAERDTTVVVSQRDVQTAVDEAFRQIRSNFASDLDFQRELDVVGWGSIDEYRSWLAEQQRRQLLVGQLRQNLRARGDLSPLPPTEEELRRYHEETRALRPPRPATVSFRQIVVRPEADSAALREAFRLADSLAGALRDGADFATVARRFSDDPASAEQGGSLGWVRRGRLVPQFERWAFDPRVRPGMISPPVQTVFGFHIIQVERAEPAEVQVRHVLIAPEITEANIERARTRAEEIAVALRDGASFDSLSALYHDEAGQEQSLVEAYPRGQLPPSYRDALALANPGDLVGPVPLEQAGRPAKYAIIVFENARPEGERTFEELHDQLYQELSERNGMERYLRTLRRATYIDIRL